MAGNHISLMHVAFLHPEKNSPLIEKEYRGKGILCQEDPAGAGLTFTSVLPLGNDKSGIVSKTG
jgi:hypothetical protein